MSFSGTNLSKELQELIKSIGETKSKQEEDRIILNELATLKPRLSEKGLSAKKIKEYLIVAMYIEMLGHSASFCHIEAINLTQNKNLVLKRLGYLLCSLFLNSKSDLTIMLISTIQKDLASTNIHEIVICLTSIDRIMNTTIAGAIIDSVVKLLDHATDLVRKKAILALQRIKEVQGGQMSDYKDKMKKALCDREPSVMAASLNLYFEEVKENPKKYRDLVPSFVVVLKQVIEHKLPKEFDYHRIPAPWIQMNLLKILEVLGKGDLKASQHCYTILEQALNRAEDGTNNIAFAVNFQTVKTICNIYPDANLIKSAARSLSRYLESFNSNVKYMGIKGLNYIYKQDPTLVENYQLIIVDCLESKDEALKKETLELLYRMTNNTNVEVIVSKMLSSLHSSTDSYFRNALVLKVTALLERYAPSHTWYIETMCMLFELGSEYLNDDILNSFLKLVVDNCEEDPNFGSEIIGKMKELLTKIVPTDFIIRASSWIFGEIGSGTIKDPSEIEKITQSVLDCFDYDFESESTKVWVIDALVKLSSTRGFTLHDQVKSILNNHSKSFDIEICQRSLGKTYHDLESKKLAKYNAALRLNNKINFEDDLGFLNTFVENALRNGAKPYKKVQTSAVADTELRFIPYEGTKPASSFSFLVNQKYTKKYFSKKEEEVQPKIKNEFVDIVKPAQDVPTKIKKPIVTPEERAKQKLASTLFSGAGKPKGPTQKATTAPSKPANVVKEDESLI